MIDVRAVQNRLGVSADGIFGPKTYAALMAHVGRAGTVGTMQVALGAAAAKYFPSHQIDTPLRIAHCLAQACVETAGFTRLVENLNYSADRIRAVWPSGFPTAAAPQPFAHNPVALANRVYGGRLGNIHPGDGWAYRGRGLKQTTGRANYEEVQKITGMPVVADPDLLADPDKGTLAGCVYWRERDCAALADADDLVRLTTRINGGLTGLDQRRQALARAKAVLL